MKKGMETTKKNNAFREVKVAQRLQYRYMHRKSQNEQGSKETNNESPMC